MEIQWRFVRHILQGIFRVWHVPPIKVFSHWTHWSSQPMDFSSSRDEMKYHLLMTNSSPWKDPPFLRTVNHLFLWGKSPFLIGKPSISIRAMASMANCWITRWILQLRQWANGWSHSLPKEWARGTTGWTNPFFGDILPTADDITWTSPTNMRFLFTKLEISDISATWRLAQ